jgi:hypothetical protein
LAVWVVVSVCLLCVAQYQVNTQVNNRVNPELYGGNTGGSVRYMMPQSQLLPSEARYATWRSGALPSEVRMNALAQGPLAPSGSVAYVPGPSALQQAMKLPQPQLYNPAYNIRPTEVAGSKPISTGPINGQLPNGTIRYNTPAQPPPKEMLAAQQTPWTQPLPSAKPLPPPTPPTPQPTQINRPPPVPTPNTSSSGSSAAAAPFYLSRLTPGSIRYSGPSTQPAP